MPWSYLLAFSIVSGTGLVASLILLGLHVPRPGGGGTLRRWLRRFEFTPEDLGGFSHWSLILASLASLFLELLLIRWISSEIRIFAYLKNFILIACFLGFGLGACLCRRAISALCLALPLLWLTALITLPWTPLREVIESLPHLLAGASQVHIWGVGEAPPDAWVLGRILAAGLVALPIFALVAIFLIPFGQMVGWYLEKARNGVAGYSLNLLASLAGILLYTVLAFMDQPPASWVAVGGLLALLLLRRRPRVVWLAGSAFAASLVLLVATGDPDTYWSPYQKLRILPVEEDGEILAWSLETNGSWYQQVIDLSPDFVRSHPERFSRVPIEHNAYNLPYRFVPEPESVLILGSGMGNDVAAAVRSGSGRVIAVEIDPTIVRLGREYHFEHPYDAPGVEVIIDDARSYMQSARDSFDLIVFSLLDSHTTSSNFSSIRIDNYVYTVEAMKAARDLLAPDGVMIVKFEAQRTWISGRLQETLRQVYGFAPLQFQAERAFTTAGRFFVTGSVETIRRALEDPVLAGYVRSRSRVEAADTAPTTDDWPYFYQRERGLPAAVAALSALVLAVCWLAIRRTQVAGSAIRPHFFFLGAGFMLLETMIISRMALLFGTTWLVNSMVISAVMLLIVVANLASGKLGGLPMAVPYTGILALIAAIYLVPLQALLSLPYAARVATAGFFLCSPVFFAGLVFIRSFARAGFAGEALGSNLLGALLGGLAESLSLLTGLRALLLVTAVFYLLSFLALRREEVRVVPQPVPAGS